MKVFNFSVMPPLDKSKKPPENCEPGEHKPAVTLASRHCLSPHTWRRGDENGKLVEQVRPLVEGGVVMQLAGKAAVDYSVKHGVTMS